MLHINLKNYLLGPLTPLSKWLVICILCFIYVFICIYASHKTGIALSVNDWLINYEAGFVRRGLGGFLLLNISELFRIRPELAVFCIKVIFYALIYAGIVWIFLKDNSTRVIDAFIVLSPCTYVFPVTEAIGSGRKEIVLLAVVTSWIVLAKRYRSVPSDYAIGLIFLAISALHEGLFFFFPLILVVLPRVFGQGGYKVKGLFVILAPSLLYIFYTAFFAHKVNDDFLNVMTKAIDPINYVYWKQGAIAALGASSEGNFRMMMNEFTIWSIPSVLMGGFAFYLPFFLQGKGLPSGNLFGANGRFIIMSLMFQLPVFAIGIDWGRWLYIDASILTLAYFSNKTLVSSNEGTCFELNSRLVISSITLGLLLTINASSWRIKYCCDQAFTLQKAPQLVIHWLREFPSSHFVKFF